MREFLREPGAVFWTFGFPLLMTLALGVAFRQQGPAKNRVGIAEGPAAAALTAALAPSPNLQVVTLPPAALEQALRRGELLLAVSASGSEPFSTAPEPAAGLPAPTAGTSPITLRFDPSRPEASATSLLVSDLLQARAGRKDPLAIAKDTSVIQGARYIDWLVPGLLGMQLLSGGLWGSAWNIVTARQRRLLKRLAATPMSRRHYLLSFRVSGLIFVPLQVVILFGFARLGFGVRIHGAFGAVLALALIASWSFAGIGLLCACRAQNTETANGLVNLATLPMYVLSGVFFSGARFPAIFQPFIRLLPLSAFTQSLRAVVNDGASLFQQGAPIAVMAVWGIVTSAIALKLFRWT